MIHRTTSGSIVASRRTPNGVVTAAPPTSNATSRQRQMRKAGGSIGRVTSASTTKSTGTATVGPSAALATGMKTSAAPKPVNPLTSPASRPAAMTAASGPGGGKSIMAAGCAGGPGQARAKRARAPRSIAAASRRLMSSRCRSNSSRRSSSWLASPSAATTSQASA